MTVHNSDRIYCNRKCPFSFLSGGEYREPFGVLRQSGSRQWRPHAGKVSFLEYFVSGLFILRLCLTVESNSRFFQIVLQGQDNRQGRGSNVGEKSFRCEYEGCGKLYTTAHHLKVSVGVLWLLVHVLYMCSWRKVFAALLVPTQVWDCLKTIFPLQHLPTMLLAVRLLFQPHCYSFVVCVSCRYTSAHTLETNHTSVTILDVGRSLQQVAVEKLIFSQNTFSWTFKPRDICFFLKTDLHCFLARLRNAE